MDTIDVTLEVELATREVEVTATFEYEGGYNGIGPYDFWGQKCFDKGTWQVEGVWSKGFTCDDKLTPEETKVVEIFLETYAEGDAIVDKINDRSN